MVGLLSQLSIQRSSEVDVDSETRATCTTKHEEFFTYSMQKIKDKSRSWEWKKGIVERDDEQGYYYYDDDYY